MSCLVGLLLAVSIDTYLYGEGDYDSNLEERYNQGKQEAEALTIDQFKELIACEIAGYAAAENESPESKKNDNTLNVKQLKPSTNKIKESVDRILSNLGIGYPTRWRCMTDDARGDGHPSARAHCKET